ncbi:MAG: AAA family ATPase, partial [Microcoleus sp.]
VLESKDQFQAIQGLAGVGKTTAMAELLAQVEDHGQEVELFGFASTHEAKSELEASLNLKSRTVASLISSGGEGRVWIVDESGMNSNREWQDVLKRATEQGVRVIMVGDPNQNSSVEAGSPLAAVIAKHPSTVQRMTKIIRQRDEKQLNAVELISAGRGAEAIKLLANDGKVVEVEDRQDRAQAVVDTFMAKPHKDRERTILVSGTNIERNAITKALRTELKTDGTLGDEVVLKNLVSKNLSDTESKLARSFEKGDYVKFYNAPRSSHFKTANLYKIVDVKGDILHLETSGGKRYIVAPAKFKGRIEGLSAGTMEVAVGDRIKFTATVKNKDWYNGTQLDVVGVSGNWIKGKDKDGKIHKIDTHEPVGITHDWVGTSYGRQGKTARFAIVSLTNDPTSARESSTVAISRQTHDIQVVTENFDQLLKWVQRSNRQPNLLDELGNSDRTITAIENAIQRFERDGGKAQALLEQELSAIIKPKPVVTKPFWTVDYSNVVRPDHIEAHHWDEMQRSGIHPDLIAKNIESISGSEVFARLLEDEFAKMEKGIKTKRQIYTSDMKDLMKRLSILEGGGWWGKAGIDPCSLTGLKSGQKPKLSTLGVFKPDNEFRRWDRKKSEYIKYENPVGTARPFFFAHVPTAIAAKIYEKHGVTPNKDELRSGFWHIVQKHNLPIVLIEGDKKALAALSQGVIAIGTPGVTLYQASEKWADNKSVKLPKRLLLPELMPFVGTGRSITIAQDQDDKPKTRRMVGQATIRSAEVLAEHGASVRITQWSSSQGKGGDDVIVQSGPSVFISAIEKAQDWSIKANKFYLSKYESGVKFAQKALGESASQKEIDVQVYSEAIERGDIYDGRRYLQFSNGFSKKGEDYFKELEQELWKKKFGSRHDTATEAKYSAEAELEQSI